MAKNRKEQASRVGFAHQKTDGDKDYSMRWGIIKKEFTKKAQNLVGIAVPLAGIAHPTKSRMKHREGTVWQRRFWEHQIRDEKDFKGMP